MMSDEDLLPHKYYHGYAFGVGIDEATGLYVPYCFMKHHIGDVYTPIWKELQRERDL